MKFYRWGAQLGPVSICWWNMWTNRPILELALIGKNDVVLWHVCLEKEEFSK